MKVQQLREIKRGFHPIASLVSGADTAPINPPPFWSLPSDPLNRQGPTAGVRILLNVQHGSLNPVKRQTFIGDAPK
nr:MAG TPA: hypothetical protein [Herelleviridae sp.]